MRKKRSPDKQEKDLRELKEAPREKSAPSFKPSGRIFGVLKFILGLCFLPFVYSVSLAFFDQVNLLTAALRTFFWSGSMIFLAVHLFVFEPEGVYYRGFRFMEVIFGFFTPLLRVAPHVIPIYNVLIFCVYAFYIRLPGARDLDAWFLFVFAFCLTLHLVLGAKQLRSKKGSFLGANYIFEFSVVYIISLTIAMACLNVIFKEVSFLSFTEQAYETAGAIFGGLSRQLFY